MISKCVQCPFFRKSKVIKSIGSCQFHDSKVRACDKACPSVKAF
ncbi:MAG: hypothetical protein AAF063_14850 [Cyanobacteria bacterium J06643_5]